MMEPEQRTVASVEIAQHEVDVVCMPFQQGNGRKDEMYITIVTSKDKAPLSTIWLTIDVEQWRIIKEAIEGAVVQLTDAHARESA